jgi:pimeloyl-ACP methyl ester carboxylesterase
MPRRSLIFVLIAGVVGCLSWENRLLYQPTRGTVAAPQSSLHPNVWLSTADGVKVHARWFPFPGAQEAILFCHGNAGNLESWASAVQDLAEALGASVLIFDYPGYGCSDGEPSEAGCYAAADAAYDWLIQAQEFRPDHVLIYGQSLGGGVAVDLASRRPHRALVLVKTFTSLPDVAQAHCPWLPARWLAVNRFDNLAKIGRCGRPVFIAQGDADRLIPFAHGQRLAARCHGAEFFRLRGSDHNDPLPPDFYAALNNFLAKTFPAGPARGEAADVFDGRGMPEGRQ